ncbi:MAG: family mycofactocin-dependent oxidoreductase [Frankiales bacterium]|nr:family mycofactocin-dependent oxidoreductase [Frankiales bacterium]
MRVALVTGAARGIGAATVRTLADDGWAVVATDRCADDPRLPYALGTREELDALSRPGQVITLPADTCMRDELAAAVAAAELDFGGLDAMIAVAGVVAGGVPVWEQSEDELVAVLEIDLYGVLTAARVAIPALLRRPAPRTGRFIAVSSAAATIGLPLLTAYGAAKAGVSGAVRGLAAELRGTGITANAVSPGSTRTLILEESARLYGLPDVEQFARQQAIERLIEPEEVATLIAWLAGPSSAAVSGADLPVDGGFTG